MTGIVTVIKDPENISFIFEKNGIETNKVIILTENGWYSLNDKGAYFMELLW